MSTAKDRVLKKLEKMGIDRPVTTAELANELNLSRSVVSHYLNDLVKSGQISKVPGHPVKFTLTKLVSVPNTAFDELIGYRGSMKSVLDRISSAVVYPPDGLNILLTGHSGVGKSFLAGKIVAYAREIKAITADAPYVVLNCADYADNPELVSSMLFGYVKGAYTGADEEKDGLLKEADGGFLFLDEVHCLSSESQEKMFNFIDSGQFYRIGDNAHSLSSKVRLIMATTEDPQKSLLTTFLRRIPVRITLPDFIEYPIDERLELLKRLFLAEAQKINKRITANSNVVSALLQLNHVGNIGYLKNMIQVSCAASYQRQKDDSEIKITLADMVLDQVVDFKNYGEIKVAPGEDAMQSYGNNQKSDSLQEVFHELLTHTSANSLNKCKLQVQALGKLTGLEQVQTGLHIQHKEIFDKIIETQFGLSKTSYLEPIMFFLYEEHFQFKDKDGIKLKEIIFGRFPRSFHVAQEFYNQIPVLKRASQQSLVIILTLLLSDHVNEKIELRGLMVAHGENTATSIQTVVNSLCENYLFDAIDMPIDADVSSTIAETNKLIDDFNTTNGFVLMVDMGSLSQLYTQISSHLDGDLLVVNNLTTLTALDIALKMKQNTPFKKIAEKADQDYQINAKYYEGFSETPNILVSCISGLGIAEKISEIIRPYMPAKIKIIPLSYNSLKEKIVSKDWTYFVQTLFVLTTIDISEPVKFNHMNLYDVLDSNGEHQLKLWLSPYLTEEQINNFNKQLLRFFSKEGISERLSFLNPDVVIQEVETVIGKYENFLKVRFDGKFKLNLYMHIALMIERLMIRNTTDIDVNVSSSKEKTFFRITRSIFQSVEIKYNIKITNYEMSLLFELFKQYL